MKVSCAAIPAGLLESELFGHERGACVGSLARRIGRFERANTGTLFLDEIGDLPLELQPRLLRLMQERQFERLGGAATIRTDVRERPEDIRLLVEYFAMHYADPMRKPIAASSEEFMAALERHSWPGYMRELQNFIERSAIVSTGAVLDGLLPELTHRTTLISKMKRLGINPLQGSSAPAHRHGPMKAADHKLRSVRGITEVKLLMKQHRLAVVDSTPAGAVVTCSRTRSRTPKFGGPRTLDKRLTGTENWSQITT